MKTDIGVVLAVAVATMAGALGLFWPAALPGGSEAAVSPAPVARPTLVCDGVQVTFRPTEEKLKPGETAAGTLTAVNTRNGPVSLTVTVRMMSASTPSPLSRRMPASQEFWHGEVPLSLAAGETRSVPVVAAGTTLQPATSITAHLQAGKESIVAARFAVAGAESPAIQPAK